MPGSPLAPLLLLTLAVSLPMPAAASARYGTVRWRGTVEDETVLELRGREVTRREPRPDPDERDRVEASAALPAAASRVFVRILRGRALVSVDEQPAAANDWTATVVVASDRATAHEVEWELLWLQDEAGSGRAEPSLPLAEAPTPTPRPVEVVADPIARTGAPVDRLRWQGRVDGKDDIVLRGDSVTVRHLERLPIQSMDWNLTAPLPRVPVEIKLVRLTGRGSVRLREEPSTDNDWSTVVRIDDAAAGADDYELELVWERPAAVRIGPGGTPLETLTWSGYVDGSDVLVVQGRDLRIEHGSGRPARPDPARFTARLPSTDRVVSLRHREGRGEVRIEQQPSADNGWTLRVRIDDEQRGEDWYEIELSWPR